VLRFWDAEKKDEVLYIINVIKGQLTFKKKESVFIQLTKKKIDHPNLKITDFKMFPNPATDKVTIQFHKSPYEEAKIELMDISGRLLINKLVRTRHVDLDVQSQPAGIYIVKTTQGNNQTIDRLIKR